MGIEKFKNLFLILIVILVIIGIPYLLYAAGSLIEINDFGYINNWWIVLLFILLLIAVFVLTGINFEKKMAHFFIILFIVSFFILGMRIGVKSTIDAESYALLLDKEEELHQLDSLQLIIENELTLLESENSEEQAFQRPDFKNHEIIFFAPGSAELSEYNKLRVTEFVSTLENCKLNVNGYSDSTGSSSSNMGISTERAQNVADFIGSLNQQNNTINKVTGFGTDHQLVENTNEISRSKNRRVTIEIIEKIDVTAEARRQKIRDELNKNRADIKNIKVERDSLRKIIYENAED